MGKVLRQVSCECDQGVACSIATTSVLRLAGVFDKYFLMRPFLEMEFLHMELSLHWFRRMQTFLLRAGCLVLFASASDITQLGQKEGASKR